MIMLLSTNKFETLYGGGEDKLIQRYNYVNIDSSETTPAKTLPTLFWLTKCISSSLQLFVNFDKTSFYLFKIQF